MTHTEQRQGKKTVTPQIQLKLEWHRIPLVHYNKFCQKCLFRVWWDGSLGKCPHHQAAWPQFSIRTTDGRRELTLASFLWVHHGIHLRHWNIKKNKEMLALSSKKIVDFITDKLHPSWMGIQTWSLWQTLEPEAERSWVWGQPGLHIKTLLKNKTKQNLCSRPGLR